MKWSKKDFMKLVNLYKSKEVIWNPVFKDINEAMKGQAWNEIAVEMDKPLVECKQKMEILLNGLKKETVKMKKHYAAGKTEPYVSPWFAFESMQFLMDNCDISPKSNNPRKRKRSISNDTSKTSKMRKTSEPSAERGLEDEIAETPSDECLQFGNFVASKLREYDISVRSAIENDIMGVFLRASKGFYGYGSCVNTEQNSIRCSQNSPILGREQTRPNYSQSAGQSFQRNNSLINLGRDHYLGRRFNRGRN